jgi:hypothetical protein
MKTYFGVGLVAAVVVFCGALSFNSATASSRSGAATFRSIVSTDISAARRVRRGHRSHRHHRPRVYVRSPYQPYYERPDYYVPRGPAPFFPFGFGYGLDPSW